MNWLRMICLAALAASCSAIGVMSGGWFWRRVEELERARGWLGHLTGLLTYTLCTPQELLAELTAQPEWKSLDYLAEARARMARGETFREAFAEAVASSRLSLTGEDRALLGKLGGIFGASDLETQLNQLALLNDQWARRIGDARAQADKNARLAPALGSLFGLALVVLMI